MAARETKKNGEAIAGRCPALNEGIFLARYCLVVPYSFVAHVFFYLLVWNYSSTGHPFHLSFTCAPPLRLLARQVPLCVSFVYGSCAPCGSYTFNRHASVKTDGNLWQVSLTLSLSFFHSSSSWLVTDETRSGLFFFLLVDNIYLYFYIYIHMVSRRWLFTLTMCFSENLSCPFFLYLCVFFFSSFLFGMMAIRIYKAASS